MKICATLGGGFAAEGVEERVGSVVGRPESEIEAPGNAAGGGGPEFFRAGVESEFIEADVTTVSAQSMRVGAEGNDAGTVIEFDVADFEVFGEAGVSSIFVNWHFPILDAVREDAFGVVEQLAELVAGADVFDGGRLVFAGEEIIAARMAKTFANVFKSVSKAPADADVFFSETQG